MLFFLPVEEECLLLSLCTAVADTKCMHAGDYAGVHLNGFHEDGNLPGNEGVRFGMAGADYRTDDRKIFGVLSLIKIMLNTIQIRLTALKKTNSKCRLNGLVRCASSLVECVTVFEHRHSLLSTHNCIGVVSTTGLWRRCKGNITIYCVVLNE